MDNPFAAGAVQRAPPGPSHLERAALRYSIAAVALAGLALSSVGADLALLVWEPTELEQLYWWTSLRRLPIDWRLVAWIMSAVLIGAMWIPYATWQVAAAERAEQRGRGTGVRPSWHAVSWLVPAANLVVPFAVFRRLQPSESSRGLFALWWLTQVIAWVGGVAVIGVLTQSLEAALVLDALLVLPATAVAQTLGVAFVWEVTRGG